MPFSAASSTTCSPGPASACRERLNVASSGARLHAVVSGYVQGVGYRYFVLHRARAAGLAGWIRNRADGCVECLAEGPRSTLEQLLEDLRRGPYPAEVTGVVAEWQPPQGDLGQFDVA